ncbi:hypothetical protein Btru_033552, partial [Bulinus truncatus]
MRLSMKLTQEKNVHPRVKRNRPLDRSDPPCTNCFYNSGRRFQCHCADRCDSEGKCIGTSTDCSSGWFGFRCQYQNLAYYYIKNIEPSRAGGLLSGSTNNQCNNDSSLQSVSVIWNMSLPFTWLRLKLADNESLYNFTLSFVLTKTSASVSCVNQTMFQVDETTFDIHCVITEATSQFKLEGKIVGSICSVKVSGGQNFALFQNTSQSSTLTIFWAYEAVDGVVANNCNYGGCSHTNDGDMHPSWTVIFDQPYAINRFTIFNRFDVVPVRLKHFELEALDNNNLTIFYYKDQQDTYQLLYTVLYLEEGLINGVRINQTNIYYTGDKNPYVSINEFQAFGECRSGYWDLNCSRQCQSPCTDYCSIEDGSCNYICIGYSDPPKCSIACPQNRFGLNCTESCRVNCHNQSCISTSGICYFCEPGYQGRLCDKSCNVSTYGANCSYNCNNTCLDKKCDSKTGACLKCPPGKYGNQCADCPAGRYGNNCEQNCSANCKNGTICVNVNGSCPLGCEPGYEGTNCSDISAYPNPGDGDTANVGIIVGPVIGGVVFLALIIFGIILCRRRKFSSRKKDVITVPDNSSFTDEPTSLEIVQKKTVSKPSLIKTPKETGGYYNTIPLITEDKNINVKDLHTFMNNHTSNQFLNEFKTLPDTPNVTTEAGLKDENRNKNRFKNICPYDHSRVHLEINTEKNEMDYINASYIEGFKKEVKFIASQGPSTVTVQDFIRMLWEQNTEKVVMLTNLIEEGKTKCEKYWHESEKMVFGDIKVKHLTTQTFAHYTVRQLELTKKNHLTHQVTQYHFTSWPDKSVPPASWSLVDFQQHVFATPTLKPIVVHCSAGVGRTGTFIALYNVTREAEETGHINFYETVIKLRQDRMLMVQTAEQYEFLHKAALAAIVCSGTTVSVDHFKDKPNSLQDKTITGKSKIYNEYKAICNVCEVYQKRLSSSATGEGDNVYQNADNAIQRQKNRFPEISPNDLYRPRLNGYNTEDGDYINAVVLPSLRQSDKQIITQLPMPTTVTDFWRLVTQYNITLVLAFEVDSMLDDQTFGHYIPSSKDPVMTCLPFEIKSVYLKDEPLWQEQKLNVFLEKRTFLPSLTAMVKESHELVHMKCKSVDLKPSQFLSFINEARKHTTLDGRVLYMC